MILKMKIALNIQISEFKENFCLVSSKNVELKEKLRKPPQFSTKGKSEANSFQFELEERQNKSQVDLVTSLE